MKTIDKFVNFLAVKLLPTASKIGNQRDLIAIRDGFAAIMPVILAGSFATLLNNVIFSPTSLLGAQFWPEGIPFFNTMLTIMGNAWWGTLAVMSLILVATVTYSLVASKHKGGALPAAGIALAAYLCMTNQAPDVSAALGLAEATPVWGYINWGSLNSSNVFAALLVALITGHLYNWFLDKKFVIKMPDTVPPAVSNAFVAVIPGIVIIFLFSTIAYLFVTYAGMDVFTWINMVVQKPFMNFSQGLPFALAYVLFIQVFWFFGLHGGNIMSVVTNGVYLPALMANVDAVATGAAPQYIFTSVFFDCFVHLGGAGATLALMVAVFIGSKRSDHKAIAKLATPASLFQINEPIMFGMPVVLNVILLIPFVLVPLVLTTTAYFATATGLVPPTYIVIPWVTPVGIGGYLATGGSVMAAALAIFNLFLATIIYLPFVMVANRQEDFE